MGEAKKKFGFIDGTLTNAGRKDKSVICKHCDREGHDADGCFQLIGYPEWWGDRPKEPSRARGRQQSEGRRQEKQTVKRRSSARVNFVQTIGEPAEEIKEVAVPGGFTSEQWIAVLNLLGKGKTGSDEKMTDKRYSEWIIDTGATQHMTGELQCLNDLTKISGCPIGLPDGSQVVAEQKGSLYLTNNLKLQNVLHAPGLKFNLISVSQLVDDLKCDVTFTNELCLIQDRISGTVIGTGERCEGLYYFKRHLTVEALQVKTQKVNDLWHKRMGHPSFKVVEIISGFEKSYSNEDCEVCLKSKQTREVFGSSDSKADDIFDIIHCDLWGPYRVRSSCNASYFLTIVDDASRCVWIYLLHDKGEVGKIMQNFIIMIKRQFDRNVKVVRSDNGTEFIGLRSYFQATGILHQTSCVGTPQQNGRVERKHRHILNVARALRFQANLPLKFWGECVLTAGYLINRTPSQVLNNKTPYEILYGKSPSYDHIRIFGCLCYAKNLNRTNDKFASRSKRCMFVGYPFGQKGWRLYDLETNEYFVSRDVIFCEDKFLYTAEIIQNDVPTSTPTQESACIEPIDETCNDNIARTEDLEPTPEKRNEDENTEVRVGDVTTRNICFDSILI